MNNVAAIGPFVLPWTFLHLVGAVGVALGLHAWLARRRGQDAGALLWRCLIVGVVFARLGFIYQYKELYAAHPLSIVNLRDGGWSAEVGIVAMWMFATLHLRNLPRMRMTAILPLAAGTVLFIAGQIALVMQPREGQLPALTLDRAGGGTLSLTAFRGRPVVLNLWATWCGPCVREMPALQAAQRERPDVHFVFVNQGEPAGQVTAWLRAQQLQLQNVAIDEHRQASAAFKQRGYPTTLFFDGSGQLVEQRTGELSEAALQATLARLR
ncbi:MAG: TlpA disulfide reductase family protein [Burkholderiaceae bacterium]